MQFYQWIACECRRISGCCFWEKWQPKIRLHSQANQWLTSISLSFSIVLSLLFNCVLENVLISCFGNGGVVFTSSLLELLLGELLAADGVLDTVFNWMPLTMSVDNSGSLALVINGGELAPQLVLTGGNLVAERLEGTVGFKSVRMRDIVFKVTTDQGQVFSCLSSLPDPDKNIRWSTVINKEICSLHFLTKTFLSLRDIKSDDWLEEFIRHDTLFITVYIKSDPQQLR